MLKNFIAYHTEAQKAVDGGDMTWAKVSASGRGLYECG